MFLNPHLPFIKCINEVLNERGILSNHILVCKIHSVRNFTRCLTDRSQNLHLSFKFQFRCSRFEDSYVITNPSNKSRSHRIKTNAIIKVHVFTRIQTIIFNHIFKSHVGHSTFSTRQNVFSFQVAPFKLFVHISANQERTITLSYLCKYHRIIFLTLQINVDNGFGTRKSNIHLTRKKCRHDLICTLAVNKFNFNIALLEKTKIHSDVLRCIEHRVSNFANLELLGFSNTDTNQMPSTNHHDCQDQESNCNLLHTTPTFLISPRVNITGSVVDFHGNTPFSYFHLPRELTIFSIRITPWYINVATIPKIITLVITRFSLNT